MSAERLAALLAAAARSGRPVAYHRLADELGLHPPGRIEALARLLEAMMAEDAAAGRPFRAAWACGRGRDGLPAPGFFVAAERLGRPAGDAAAFVAAERAGAFPGPPPGLSEDP